MECAAYLLRDKGDLFMVHRPARLVDICCFGRAAGLELKELIFVSPSKAVSYTHLDVYKRQTMEQRIQAVNRNTLGLITLIP